MHLWCSRKKKFKSFCCTLEIAKKTHVFLKVSLKLSFRILYHCHFFYYLLMESLKSYGSGGDGRQQLLWDFVMAKILSYHRMKKLTKTPREFFSQWQQFNSLFYTRLSLDISNEKKNWLIDCFLFAVKKIEFEITTTTVV